MSIEADAQKDLALNPEDAENVVGGKKKAKKKAVPKKTAVVHKTAGLPASINRQTGATPTESSYEEDENCERIVTT